MDIDWHSEHVKESKPYANSVSPPANLKIFIWPYLTHRSIAPAAWHRQCSLQVDEFGLRRKNGTFTLVSSKILYIDNILYPFLYLSVIVTIYIYAYVYVFVCFCLKTLFVEQERVEGFLALRQAAAETKT